MLLAARDAGRAAQSSASLGFVAPPRPNVTWDDIQSNCKTLSVNSPFSYAQPEAMELFVSPSRAGKCSLAAGVRFFFLIFFATAVFPINRKHAECLDETSSMHAAPRCVCMYVFEVQMRVFVCLCTHLKPHSQQDVGQQRRARLFHVCQPALCWVKKEKKDNDKVKDEIQRQSREMRFPWERMSGARFGGGEGYLAARGAR